MSLSRPGRALKDSKRSLLLIGWSPLWSVPPAESLAEWGLENDSDVRFCSFDENGAIISGVWPATTPVPNAPSRLPGSSGSRVIEMARRLRSEAVRTPSTTHIYFDFRALTIGSFAMPRQQKVAYCLDVTPSGPLRRRAERWAVARADLAVITESAKAGALGLDVTSPRLIVVRNAVPKSASSRIREWRQRSDIIKRGFGIPVHSRIAIHAGGLAPEFGVFEESMALTTLPEDVYLVFLGRSMMAPGQQADRVRWTGRVTREAWEQWIAVADVGLAFWVGGSPSDFPFLPWNTPLSWNRLYWYLAAGIPIAAGGHAMLESFVRQHGVGVATGDVSAQGIGAAVQVALIEAPHFGAAAKEVFESELNFDSQITKLTRALES